MKKTIKIIDLLNKIANGEKVPKKIKLDGKVYLYSETYEQYHNENDINLLETISEYNYSGLNDEVEILDEEEFEDIDDEFESGDTVQVVMQLVNRIKPLIRNQKKIIKKITESE